MMRVQIHTYYILYALILGFLLTGCKVRRPDGVIPEDKMENLLYDYHIARAISENLSYNENYKRVLYVDYVFEKHGTTQAVFDSSMVWYTRHVDILSKIYERINTRFKAEQTELDRIMAIRENRPTVSKPGDSIDVWSLERMLYLNNIPINNKLAFTIPSDSNFKARDTLQWDVNYHIWGANSDSMEIALMAMAIQYTNDSILNVVKGVYESGLQRIRIQSDTLGDIKEIRGFIYFKGHNDSIKHLFADQISLIRYHSNDSLFNVGKDSVVNKEKVEVDSIIPEKEIKPDTTPVQERINPTEIRRERPRPLQRMSVDQPNNRALEKVAD